MVYSFTLHHIKIFYCGVKLQRPVGQLMDDVRIRLSEKASVQFIRRKVDSVAEDVTSPSKLFQILWPADVTVRWILTLCFFDPPRKSIFTSAQKVM